VTAYLNRDHFFQKRDRRFEDVDTEIGTVRIRALTTGERARYEASLRSADGNIHPERFKQFRERILVACCVNEEGKPLFTVEDIPALQEVPSAVTAKIHTAAWKLSGFTADDVAELEELAGN
jgi:hypothetical protein